MGIGKKLLKIGISIGSIAGVAVLTALALKDKDDSAYSSDWLSNASDDELDIEREKVRQEYCSSGDDFERAVDLENTLHRFDKEISKRAWDDEEPKAPSIHREHGWYLSNDD